MVCNFASDIEDRMTGGSYYAIDHLDALELSEKHLNNYGGCDYIITNPPWSRNLLHPIIEVFRNLRPTWLLFDADWMHTKQSSEYMKYCSDVISVGRVKWIPDSKHTGKDNACWYMFHKTPQTTIFHGR